MFLGHWYKDFNPEIPSLSTVDTTACGSQVCGKVAVSISTLEAPDCKFHGAPAQDFLDNLLEDFEEQWAKHVMKLLPKMRPVMHLQIPVLTTIALPLQCYKHFII